MSMVIANNMQAVNTKRQFAISGRGQSSAMEKLSSGYKINTGKDDPSGLVISEKLRSQLNGLKRAQQNTEEAINVMGIAEGALNEMNAILKKMKALAIHSNNTGVTSPDQIAADQAEMDSAVQTLDRIAQTTKFSEENLLNGAKDIAYERTTASKGTQQNSLLDVRETGFSQIFKRDDYAVSISFTGTTNADMATGAGDVDFTQQASKAYLEVDTSKDPTNTAQLLDGAFTTAQQFTLTGTKGSRAFNFKKGETVATMVEQIKSAADSTGIDAALVFNSDQQIHMTATGTYALAAGADITDQTFTIDGVNQAAAGNPPVTKAVEFTLKEAMNDYMEESNTDSLTFAVGVDGTGNVELSVTVAGGGDLDGDVIKLTSGWNGASGTLVGALDAKLAEGADADTTRLINELKANLTQSGDINIPASNLAPTTEVTAGTTAATKITVENVFAAGDGKVEMSVGTNTASFWNDIRAGLTADKQALFDTAAANGTLEVGLKINGQQDAMSFEMTVTDGGANTFVTQKIDMSDAQATTLQNTGATSLNVTGGAFNNATIAVTAETTDLSTLVEGATNSVAVTNSNFTGGTMVSKSTAVASTATAAMTTDLTAAALVAETVTVTNLKDTAGDDVKIDISTAVNGDATKMAALVGNGVASPEMTLKVVLNSGQDQADLEATPGDATYSLIATIDGEDYTLANDWDGTSGSAVTATGAELYAMNDGADTRILDALTEFTFTAQVDVGFENSHATNGVFDSAKAFVTSGTPTMTSDATKILEGIYGATPHGDVSIKFDNVDFTAFLNGTKASIPDFAAAFETGGNGKISATLEAIDSTDPTKGFNIHLTFTDSTGANPLASAVINWADISGKMSQGQTVDAAGKSGGTDGWYKLESGSLAGMEIQIVTDPDEQGAFKNTATNLNAAGPADSGALAVTIETDVTPLESDAVEFEVNVPTSAGQVGGVAADDSAARKIGTVAVFNNILEKNADGVTTGEVDKGVAGLDITTAGTASVQLGQNTDGQGRVYVKFLDDQSFELYKDASMSKESLVATGTNGKEIQQANNSGLSGITLNLAGEELTKVSGVYFSLAGVEGRSENQDYSVSDAGAYVSKGNGTYGVSYSGDVIGKVAGDATKDTLFNQDLTYITGVELGKNTDNEGKVYLKSVYDDKNKTIKVEAYKDRNMRAEDLIATSDLFSVEDTKSMTVVLNEVRNADNTAGTGFGMVLSTNAAMFEGIGKDRTFESEVTFQNLGARLFAQDYGSANYLKITQDKGNIFNYYGTPGDNGSKQMIDATSGGITVQVNGQDATLSINGSQVKTNGLELKMATQDIQANLVFNAGSVGSTTLAQVGYDAGSIFTKNGALNLGSEEAEAADSGKYEHLSGKMANAGHVTNERVDDFQGGMQLQLGEGAGDQNRTIVAIKSVTSENLGRVTKGGYWDGNAVYTERTFTMKDVFGGGAASLKQSPTMAMAVIEQSIADVSELRAQIGAVQSNMLQTNSNNLAVTMENIQKTESGIRDADMADEMTEFTKNQVLQSAAMSMMSQANQSSQNVLQLLR